MSPRQSRQTLAREAGLPGRDETRVASQLIDDRLARGPVLEQQDQPRTSHLTYGHRATALHRHQFLALGFAQIHLVHAPFDQCNFTGVTDQFACREYAVAASVTVT